jgi:hypothetical protein
MERPDLKQLRPGTQGLQASRHQAPGAELRWQFLEELQDVESYPTWVFSPNWHCVSLSDSLLGILTTDTLTAMIELIITAVVYLRNIYTDHSRSSAPGVQSTISPLRANHPVRTGQYM